MRFIRGAGVGFEYAYPEVWLVFSSASCSAAVLLERVSDALAGMPRDAWGHMGLLGWMTDASPRSSNPTSSAFDGQRTQR